MSAEDMDIDTDDGSDDDMVDVEETGADGPPPAPLLEGNMSVPNSTANQPAAAVPASTSAASTTKRKPSRTVSIAHEDMEAGKLVLVHVDIETTAGSDKEIVQLSCVMADYRTNQVIGEFDEYVQPPKDTDWDFTACQGTHGLLPNDARITEALSIKEVWPKFVEFCESGIGAGAKVGAFVAWNGKTDLEAFFRITEYTYKDQLVMPKGYDYFIDPMAIIKGYTGCKLNDKHRRDDQNKGYALDATYQAAFGTEMDGAHSSIVDARAQHKIVSDSRVHPYLDRNKSVEKVTEIWSAKFKRMNAARAEITRPVPVGYTDGGNEEFEPSWANSYEGPLGGGQAGPSSAALTACDGRDLAAVFLSFITVSMLASISVETNRYGNEQWVRPVSNEEYHSINEANAEEGGSGGNGEEEGDGGERRSSRKTAISIGYDSVEVELDLSEMEPEEARAYGEDDDSSDSSYHTDHPPSLGNSRDDDDSDDDLSFGSFDEEEHSAGGDDDSEDDDDLDLDEDEYDKEPKKKQRLVECSGDHPDKRKRWLKDWVDVTPGYLLAWLGILVLVAAFKTRSPHLVWSRGYGLNLAFIRNVMSRDRFDQIKRCLHFVNNSNLPKRGGRKWNPIQKVKSFIDEVQKNIRNNYVIGRYLCADESMIKYKGKSVKYVQYMPAKPTKHGIKVFALCCALTGYIYAFYVYTGKENDPASATQIVQRLLALDPELVTNSKGRVMFTDNYYTSEELEAKLYEDYGMLLVGTVKLTKKLSRTVADFAFHRLSNAAKKLVSRGWTRTAQKAVTGTNNNTARIVQCTTWMDRKQVGILHNYMVGEPGDFQTMRWDATLHERVPVSSHKIIPEYIRRMRGVDRADRSMADYDISLKSNRYYLRIVFYTINAAIVCMWIICLNVATTSARTKDPWKKYTRSEGRLKWTIDLGHALIAKGIKMDWGNIHDNTKRPKWIRQQAFLPCDCGLCFFCTENLTGLAGPPTASPRKHRRPSSPEPNVKHVQLLNERVEVCSGKNCGECMRKGRKRKPKAGQEIEGVEYAHKTRLGCPHPNCRDHPVCEDCWPDFKHNK